MSDFREGDKGVTKTTRFYCDRCGLLDEPKRLLLRHCAGVGKGKCPGKPVRGPVLFNKYKLHMPIQFINDIVNGRSPVPHVRKSIVIPHVMTSAIHAPSQSLSAATAIAAPDMTTAVAANAATTTMTSCRRPPKRIRVSDTEMTKALKPVISSYPADRQCIIMESIKQLDAAGAEHHKSFFIHIILDGTSNLRDLLMSKVASIMTPFQPSIDDRKLQILMHAANLWLTSQSANIDVYLISTHMRSAMYRVGDNVDDDDSDFVRGGTFVPTGNLEYVASEIRCFLSFLFRGNHIDSRNLHCLEKIIDSVPYEDSDVEGWLQNVSNRVLITNILPSIILNAVLCHPNMANSSTQIYDYIAARSIQILSDDITITTRSPNSISRSANALLRIIRHALCSHLQLTAEEINTNQEPENSRQSTFEQYGFERIQEARSSPSVGHICLRIRSAKELDKKMHSIINKMVDVSSGDVYINGAVIPYTVWSHAIPRAIQLVESAIDTLYPNIADVNSIRDINNQLVFCDDQHSTHVIVSNDGSLGDNTRIYLHTLTPALPAQTDSCIQSEIVKCAQFVYFCFGYLGMGALRGTEIVQLQEFNTMQFIFNSIRYQVRSNKGERHGVANNNMIDHFLSPTISRLVILIIRNLLPAIKKTSNYYFPEKRNAPHLADHYFMHVFKLKAPLGPKNNRQALASISNFLCPSKESRLTSSKHLAQCHQHTARTHDLFYSDAMIDRLGDDIIDTSLLTARYIWACIGEPHHPRHQRMGCLLSPTNIESYHQTAKHLYGNNASVTNLQMKAIMHITDESACSHAFVLMATGLGKSGLYNIALGRNSLFGGIKQQIIVISPHNSLLLQHYEQSLGYLKHLQIHVACYESSDIPDDADADGDWYTHIGNSDLVFLSISAFYKIRNVHPNSLHIFSKKILIIDEYHNLLAESFRFSSSWEALNNIAQLNAKIICMSATSNKFVMDKVGKYLGMGQYTVIGSTDDYPIPNVRIEKHEVDTYRLNAETVSCVVNDYNHDTVDNIACHVIVLSIEAANDIASKLEEKKISARALHSERTKDDRQKIMKDWSGNKFKVLVSTLQDGIDSSKCKRVVVSGGSHNVIALIQSIGRIRPPQQTGFESKVTILDTTNHIDINADSNIDISMATLTGATLLSLDDRDNFESLFGRKSYKKVLTDNGCLLQQIYNSIGIQSKNCNICTNCMSKNDIVKAMDTAVNREREETEKANKVAEYLRSMLQCCYICKGEKCDGRKCLSKNSCWKCHKDPQFCHNRLTCTLNRHNIFESQQYCTWCFIPKERCHITDVLGSNIIHRNATNIECTFNERAKRVILYSQRDNGESTTLYLKKVFSSKIGFINSIWNTCQFIDKEKSDEEYMANMDI